MALIVTIDWSLARAFKGRARTATQNKTTVGRTLWVLLPLHFFSVSNFQVVYSLLLFLDWQLPKKNPPKKP